MLKYIVKDVVCDYGIFLVDENDNGEMIDICNSRANALKVCEILNADKEHIVWKEKQLENAIIPKFKIEQEVWFVNDDKQIYSGEVLSIQKCDWYKQLVYTIGFNGRYIGEEYLFETKEQAEQHLKLLDKDKKDTI